MNSFPEFLDHPLAYRLGWTLLHFLWQGSVIALALAAAHAALRRHSAEARYTAASVALALMALAPLVTFNVLSDTSAMRGFRPRSVEPVAVNPATRNLATQNNSSQTVASHAADLGRFSARLADSAEPLLPWLAMLWFTGVAVLSTRLVAGWYRVQQLQRRQIEPLGEPWISQLEQLRQRLAITRPVRLFKSALVEVPTVIGWLKPVILLPASSLTGLTPHQLESILAHELAHVRRNDYLVNLFQRVIETLLFYHPAVWWVSRCIRQEREHCCDDLAICVCGDRLGYARALASLEALRSQPTDFALAADGGSLMSRVRRLFGLPTESQPFRLWPMFLLLTLGVVLGALSLGGGWFQPLYQSDARLLVKYVIQDDSINPDATKGENRSLSHDREAILQSEMEILASGDSINKVVELLGADKILAKARGDINTARAAQYLAERLSIENPAKSDVIRVSLKHPDPVVAQKGVENLIRFYQFKHTMIHGVGVEDEQIKKWIDKSWSVLASIDDELRNLYRGAGILSLKDYKATAGANHDKARQALEEAQTKYKELQVALKVRQISVYGIGEGAIAPPNQEEKERQEIYREIVLQLNRWKEEKMKLLLTLTEQDAGIQKAKKEIANFEAQLKKLEEEDPQLAASRAGVSVFTSGASSFDAQAAVAEFASLTVRVQSMTAQYSNLVRQAETVARNEGRIVALERLKETEEKNLEYYKTLQAKASRQEVLGAPNIQVIQKTSAPRKLSWW